MGVISRCEAIMCHLLSFLRQSESLAAVIIPLANIHPHAPPLLPVSCGHPSDVFFAPEAMATTVDLTAEEPPRPELVQLSYDEIASGANAVLTRAPWGLLLQDSCVNTRTPERSPE